MKIVSISLVAALSLLLVGLTSVGTAEHKPEHATKQKFHKVVLRTKSGTKIPVLIADKHYKKLKLQRGEKVELIAMEGGVYVVPFPK